MALFEKISMQEKIDFIKNLSLLIKSGKPINESFALLSEQFKSPELKKVLKKAKEKSEKGTPLYEIFGESKAFDEVFVSFIRAGEESGTLDENLENLGNWLERNHKLKKEISSATLYPKIIISFAILLGGGLTIFVLPQLVQVFQTLPVELPVTTQMMLAISEVMRESGLYVVGLVAGLMLTFYLLLKIRAIRRIYHTLSLKFPVGGTISQEYQLTIISQLVATLLRSGITLDNALDIVSESVTNIRYEEALEEVRDQISAGNSFTQALGSYPGLFPGLFVSVVNTGEETGSYSDSFQYLADFFSLRVTERTKRLPPVLEPMLLIAIGIFVAFIAHAIVIPIYEVTEGLY